MEKVISKIADKGATGLFGILLLGCVTGYGIKILYCRVEEELYSRGETDASIQAQLTPFLNFFSSVSNQIKSDY